MELNETPAAEEFLNDEPIESISDAITHPELEEAEIPAENLAGLGKKELLQKANEAAKADNLKDATAIFRSVKPLFDQLCRDEYQEALSKFIEEGGEKEEFILPEDKMKAEFELALQTLKKRREEHRQQIESEKQENLKAKRNLLERLKVLSEAEETEKSIDELKSIQAEWKKIKGVPAEEAEDLWKTYRFFVDKFYDNRSIYFELKENDRQRNLTEKIKLCVKADELKNEPSMRKAMTMLNRLHEEWRSLGPVPREYNEEIWTRFKAASDAVHAKFDAFVAEQESKRTENLQKKLEIIDRLEAMLKTLPEKAKEWNDKAKEVSNLMADWKKIGPASKEKNTEIWDKFRTMMDSFYKTRNGFFKDLNKVKNENLRQKLDLCHKAEALKDSQDWGKTSKELINLQETWKKIGPVPDKQSDAIWKRFRAACDAFFTTKQNHFAGLKESYQTNLELKTSVIEKLEQLLAMEDNVQLLNAAKALQEEWSKIGFVANEVKDQIYKRYSDALDKIYARVRAAGAEVESAQLRSKFEFIAKQADGKQKLASEIRRINERIKTLNENIDTWQNNILFFSNSKNLPELQKKVDEDVANAQRQIKKLKEQVTAIRAMQNEVSTSK